jgi:tRNA threonylcarbamoyladenosine biosynthesis protein TsaE
MAQKQELPKASVQQHCRQEADTAALAKLLAAILSHYLAQSPQNHLNIALEGDLGAGKTTFARYLIQALGHDGKVKSPSYTLCEPYPVQVNQQAITIHHFDLYRMRDPLEWQEAGFAEYFDIPGICLIEWPEKAEGTLPAFDIQIQFTAGSDETERSIQLHALTQKGTTILEEMVAK